MGGKVYYYISPTGENPVRAFINSLEERQRAKIRRIFLTVSEYGLEGIKPHVKKISGTPFYEIRILGQDNIRILYVTASREGIVVLHGFIKKSQKTPEREMAIAVSRYKSWVAMS